MRPKVIKQQGSYYTYWECDNYLWAKDPKSVDSWISSLDKEGQLQKSRIFIPL